jgi:hypothetical protein
MSHTVRCNLCSFEVDRRCIEKNSEVKVNKPRHCKLYKEDENKVIFMEDKRERGLTPIITRPDTIDGENCTYFWDGKKYKKIKTKAVDNQTYVPDAVFSTVDNKYPLTGDLSRFFKSTASEE